MIKSKFNTFQSIGRFVAIGLGIISIFTFYEVFWGKRPAPLLSAFGATGVFFGVIFPVYIIAQIKLNYKTIVIDTALKTISFTPFLIPLTKTYPLEYFDGYIDTTVTDKYDTYKCFYLVKDGKLKYKTSGRYYDNIDELHDGISSLKCMGFMKYTVSLSIKIALHKTVI